MSRSLSLAAAGGVGDGRTDNTTAMARALASGATTIVTPPGVWRFQQMGAWPGPIRDRTFVGEPGSVWLFDAGIAVTTQQVWNRVTVQGLTIRAPNAQGFTLWGRGVGALTITDCTFEDISIAVLNGCQGPVVVQRCTWTQSAQPPAIRNGSMANVTGPWTVEDCVWDFQPHSPAGVLVSVLGQPPGRVLTGPYTFRRNQVFVRNAPGYTIDGAFDIEPHQPQPVGTVTVADNVIYNASIYITGAREAVVQGNTIHFTPVVMDLPHAPPLVTYSSYTGAKPPTGRLQITGNTITLAPTATTTVQATPLVLRGGGTIQTAVIQGNTLTLNPQAHATTDYSNTVKACWADARETATWTALTLAQNRIRIPAPIQGPPGPLFSVEAGRGGIATVTVQANTVTGPVQRLTGFLATPQAAGSGRIGTVVVSNNQVAAPLPVSSGPPGPQTALVQGNTNLTGTFPPPPTVPTPNWLAWGLVALGAGSAATAAWWLMRPH
jgi:hypothetical protein